MNIPFTLRQLQYFQAAATTGSLAAAAEQMHVTPTALALALQEFEKRLGLTLMLRRKGRGIILTGEGQRILEKSQALLADAVHLLDEASDSRQDVSGGLWGWYLLAIAPICLAPVHVEFITT